MNENLNTRQEKFCLEYAKRGNATVAYMIAYATENKQAAAVCGAKLLKKANIKKRLRELSVSVARDKIADSVEVQEFLTSIIRQNQKSISVKDAIKAAELLSRIQGFYNGGIEREEETAIVILPSNNR